MEQNILDCILRSGGNTVNSRQRIALEFMKKKPDRERENSVRKLFNGYNGFCVNGRYVAVTYAPKGIYIADGRSVKSAENIAFVSWEDACARIEQLLAKGEFTSRAELTDAANWEIQLLADSILCMTSELSEDARKKGHLAEIRQICSYNSTAEKKIADVLQTKEGCEWLTEILGRFVREWRVRPKLLRYQVRNPEEIFQRVKELILERRTFTSAWDKVPSVKEFITEDEILDILGGGSNFEETNQRIKRFFEGEHTKEEMIDFLRHEFGTGGCSPAWLYAWNSGQDHNYKGIRLYKTGACEIFLPWSKVAQYYVDMYFKERAIAQSVCNAKQSEAIGIDQALEIVIDKMRQLGLKYRLSDFKYRMNGKLRNESAGNYAAYDAEAKAFLFTLLFNCPRMGKKLKLATAHDRDSFYSVGAGVYSKGIVFHIANSEPTHGE